MFGLPLHPLVVHAVVVLLPLAALGLMALVAVPSLRQRYAPLTLAVATVAAASAVVARWSGEALAEVLSEPTAHVSWGTYTAISAVALAVFGWVWWVMDRRDASRKGQRGVGVLAIGALVVAAALASLLFVALAGHSGATATWQTRIAQAQAGPPASATYTMAQVAEHDDAESCWAAVDGSVHDLTAWIGQHPGGAARILALCGTDASDEFRVQHDDDSRPGTMLDSLRIGALA